MKLTRKLAGLVLATAVIVGGLSGAQAAQADEIANGGLAVTPTTGNKADAQFIKGFSTTVGCPEGYRASSGTFPFQNGVRLGNLATARTPSVTLYGSTGLTGAPINMDDFITSPSANPFVSNKSLEAAAPNLQTGNWELRVYCFSVATSPNYATDKWFSLPMSIDAAGVWKVGPADVVVPVPAQATNVSLTGNYSATDYTTALTATVKDTAAAVLPTGSGTVEFLEGTTVLGTSPVTAGVATFTTPPVAVGSHTFTARFVPTDAAAYAPSTSSGYTIVRPTGPAAPGSTVIDVTIPAGTGALTFAGLQSTISLGTATLDAGLFKASGDLGPVIVTDTRQIGSSAWSLTGVTTDFKDGTKTIDGKYLGWTPALVGTSNAGIAGATVAPAPGSTNGLKTSSPLSTGSVVDGITTTTVGAKLNLAAPGNTPGGFYTSTLTLTLI